VLQRVTIGSLPDNVLLDIFDFYQVLINKNVIDEHPWNWEKLVHVCRSWRHIIFDSPVRLNLQLFCTENSPVRELLDVWPPFPLAIRFTDYEDSLDSTIDNLIAALEHRDRVREIQIRLTMPRVRPPQQIFTAMEEPFPVLRSLSLGWSVLLGEKILPDSLLNGSSPCLRRLTLLGISFPSLPQFLLSTSDLTSLNLINIPNSGYISPETMATSLSALPKLECLIINFKSTPVPYPERPALVQTRLILPALTSIGFQGVSEYFEVLAARFDAPLLVEFVITFFHQLVFDIPETIRFFSHLDSFKPSSLTLTFKAWNCAYISFTPNTTHYSAFPLMSNVWKIACEDSSSQVVSIVEICGQIPSFRSAVKSLTIEGDSFANLNHPMLWLQLFYSFPSVQSLQIPVKLEPFIASMLERAKEEPLIASASDVFPSLHSLFIVGDKSDETVQGPIQLFIADRQRSGRPIAVSRIQKSD
jgi:F-box-like